MMSDLNKRRNSLLRKEILSHVMIEESNDLKKPLQLESPRNEETKKKLEKIHQKMSIVRSPEKSDIKDDDVNVQKLVV
mgnify:CR=1 FL=1